MGLSEGRIPLGPQLGWSKAGLQGLFKICDWTEIYKSVSGDMNWYISEQVPEWAELHPDSSKKALDSDYRAISRSSGRPKPVVLPPGTQMNVSPSMSFAGTANCRTNAK